MLKMRLLRSAPAHGRRGRNSSASAPSQLPRGLPLLLRCRRRSFPRGLSLLQRHLGPPLPLRLCLKQLPRRRRRQLLVLLHGVATAAAAARFSSCS